MSVTSVPEFLHHFSLRWRGYSGTVSKILKISKLFRVANPLPCVKRAKTRMTKRQLVIVQNVHSGPKAPVQTSRADGSKSSRIIPSLRRISTTPLRNQVRRDSSLTPPPTPPTPTPPPKGKSKSLRQRMWRAQSSESEPGIFYFSPRKSNASACGMSSDFFFASVFCVRFYFKNVVFKFLKS